MSPDKKLPSPPGAYQPPDDLLKNRTILVTGAAGGLGHATALICAKLGATIILLGRAIPPLEALYDEIIAVGPEPAIYPMDLAGAKWSDYGSLAVTLAENFGTLDGIVHAAAHFKAFAPLSQLPPAEWMESLQVNLTASYALTNQCLPLLEKSADASVVFIADSATESPRAYSGAYGLAKYAQGGLARTWAEELQFKPQLRFNCYDPGPMRSALRRRGYPNEDKNTLPEPQTAVAPLLWLLGPDSHGYSGQTLHNPAPWPAG